MNKDKISVHLQREYDPVSNVHNSSVHLQREYDPVRNVHNKQNFVLISNEYFIFSYF
jgi:hypothetical protein